MYHRAGGGKRVVSLSRSSSNVNSHTNLSGGSRAQKGLIRLHRFATQICYSKIHNKQGGGAYPADRTWPWGGVPTLLRDQIFHPPGAGSPTTFEKKLENVIFEPQVDQLFDPCIVICLYKN